MFLNQHKVESLLTFVICFRNRKISITLGCKYGSNRKRSNGFTFVDGCVQASDTLIEVSKSKQKGLSTGIKRKRGRQLREINGNLQDKSKIKRRVSSNNVGSEVCPFKLVVFLSPHDDHWYLMVNKNDEYCSHRGHLPVLPHHIKTRTRLIDEETLELAQDCHDAGVNNSQAVALLHGRSDNVLQARHI